MEICISKLEIWVEIWWKCRNRLCQNLKLISIFEKFGFEKMRNRDIKTKILIFKEFGFPKNKKSGPQILKFDFGFLGQEIGFENLKIVFSNSFRISIWDLKIWNRQHRKPQNLDFRFKIQIFLRPKSWFCIRSRARYPTWWPDALRQNHRWWWWFLQHLLLRDRCRLKKN